MKISVLCPVLNGQRYIREMLESVLTQKGSFTLELIVIDGQSTDSTFEIIDEYYQKYLKNELEIACQKLDFIFLSAKDHGMYDALAKGFELCTGDIIGWINSDDYYLPGAFEKINGIFKDNKQVSWISGRANSEKNGEYVWKSILRYFPRKMICSGAFGLYSDHFIAQENTFWRKKLLDYIDMDVFRSFQYAGDFYLWANYAKYFKLYSCDEDFAVFRIHEDNKSKDREAYRKEMKRSIFMVPDDADAKWVETNSELWKQGNKDFEHIGYDESSKKYVICNKERSLQLWPQYPSRHKKTRAVLCCNRNNIKTILRKLQLFRKSYEISIVYDECDTPVPINNTEVGILAANSTGLLIYNNLWARVKQMQDAGIKEIYIIPSELIKTRRYKMLFDGKDFLIPLSKWHELPVAKFLVSEKCNLNCSGCTHFVPLNDTPQIMGIEEYIRYLNQLKKIFKYIKEICLLGGEPLLNDNLSEMIRVTRKKFPYADISIITNGLLITKMSKELINAAKKAKVFFFVTEYEPCSHVIEDALKFLDKNELPYSVSERVTEFRLQYNSSGKNDSKAMYSACLDKYCHTISDGKIYNCYFPATVKWANKKFGLNIPYEGIDLFNSDRKDAVDIIKKLSSPMEICSFCNGFNECPMVPWKSYKGGPQEEWFSE